MNMSDAKFYGKILLGVAVSAWVLSRVVPGIGMRVGLRPDPLPFIPSVPVLNPTMRASASPSGQMVTARADFDSVLA